MRSQCEHDATGSSSGRQHDTMPLPPITVPDTDPVPIYELFNAGFGSKLLVAATVHLNLFGHLVRGPLSAERLRNELGVSERAFQVLMTGLRAFELIELDDRGHYAPTEMARTHLTPGGPFNVTDYLQLAEDARGEGLGRPAPDRPARRRHA